jgi:hypothetical protein
MRPIEAILLFTNLLAFLVLAYPLPSRICWLIFAVPLSLFIYIIQIVLEGPRWQMVPGYILTGMFFLIWLIKNILMRGKPIEHNGIYWIIFGLSILFIFISVALPVMMPVFRLPTPKGPYKIGTLTYHWVDTDRPEVFTSNPNDQRELMVQIWYPSKGGTSSSQAPYVQNSGVLAPLAKLLNLPGFMLGHFKYITTNAILSAPVADGEASYPVLIFSHGRGGFRQHNTWQIEELVSQGYIVASIDHPYAASGVIYPDGHLAAFDNRMLNRSFVDSMIPYLAQDAIFTLNQLTALNRADPNGILTERLDMQRAGIFGLSLGGEVTAEACLLEQRFKACLIMDVWMPKDVLRQGLKQPTMWISRDAESMKLEGWTQEDIDETQTTMQTVFENLQKDGYMVRIQGMFHQDFSDAPLFSPLTSLLGVTGPINTKRAHDITSAYSLAFFEKHLKNKQELLLERPAEQYPEVSFERH